MTYVSEPMTAPAVSPNDLALILRPYAWIASVFFATGFLGWFIVHPL